MATRKHTEISIKEKVETVMETVMERVVDSWLKSMVLAVLRYRTS